MDRIIEIIGELSTHGFAVQSMRGKEALSCLYALDIELVSQQADVSLKEIVGRPLALKINAKSTRFINGIVTEISLTGREESGNRFYVYHATVSPLMWYLTNNKNCRHFQDVTVPDILMEICRQYKIEFENRLTSVYRIWGYCVQYQETDFDFISRLMEHEGIYYYFVHHAEGHILILADAPSAHHSHAGYEMIPYHLAEGGLVKNTEAIHHWEVKCAVTPTLYSTDDYDFRKPRAHLLEAKQNPASGAQNMAEIFDWPGCYTESSHGQFYAGIRQQEFEARHEEMSGATNALGVAPGYCFSLSNAPRQEDEREYLVLGVTYDLQTNPYATDDNEDAFSKQKITFHAIPSSVNWRPARRMPWPKTSGPQTAEVTGPEGEDIWTDKYGRVKVKFRWDRYSQTDASSSCWVRVSSLWAGWKYGNIQVPRVGEEVLVDFINGDPDRPVITGRLYNEENMPPLELPGNAAQMGIISRSKGGNSANASSLIMDDTFGRESFNLHAERDMKISVEKNQQTQIQGEHVTTIGAGSSLTVSGDATQNTSGNNSDITAKTKKIQAACVNLSTALLNMSASDFSFSFSPLAMSVYSANAATVGFYTTNYGFHMKNTDYEFEQKQFQHSRVAFQNKNEPIKIQNTVLWVMSGQTKISTGTTEINNSELITYL